MFFGDAEAKTSAGAPEVIWVARPELAPKLNVTFTPGCAASNRLPIAVNASFSEAAANTVIDPDSAAGLDRLGLVDAELPLGPHPATADTASPAAITVIGGRRTPNSGK